LIKPVFKCLLAFYVQQISDKPGHTVKAKPCGFCKKNLPLIPSSAAAIAAGVGERIFFYKSLAVMAVLFR